MEANNKSRKKLIRVLNIVKTVVLTVAVFIVGSFTYSLYFGMMRMSRYFALIGTALLVAVLILSLLELGSAKDDLEISSDDLSQIK